MIPPPLYYMFTNWWILKRHSKPFGIDKSNKHVGPRREEDDQMLSSTHCDALDLLYQQVVTVSPWFCILESELMLCI